MFIMKPLQKITFLFAGLLFVGTGLAFGQKKNIIHAHKSTAIDSAKWRKDNYIVNRDSAFANPYFALQKLTGGNRRFTESRSIYPRQNPALIKKLASGQSPFATIVGCSDSRVSAEILFDQGFGDLFIVRTAGQVMAEASYGTLEYGYLALKTKLIVVLGHTNCGAVEAAVKRPENPPGHIVSLINAIKPAAIAAKKMPGNVLDNAIRLNVINQVNHLRQLEPVLSKNYEEGKLLIVGAVYDLGTGKVTFLKETLEHLPATAFARHDITGK
jgi:carbonic anhydrase